MNSTLFRKESLDRISSPEQLNDYIKVSNPSIWTILIAMCVLMAAFLIWSVTGSLPTNVSSPGVMLDGRAVCYLSPSDAAAVKAGQIVSVTPAGNDKAFGGTVASVGATPMSSSEIAGELKSDYLTETLSARKFSVMVVVRVNATGIQNGTVLNVKISVDEKKPIDFLSN